MQPHWLNGLERGKDGVLSLAQRALELRAGVRPERFDGARIAAVFLNPSFLPRGQIKLETL